MPNGAIVFIRPKPRQTHAQPGARCRKVKDGVFAPPRPGLRALHGPGKTVIFHVNFAPLPRACRPVRAIMTMDNNGDARPSTGPTINVKRRIFTVRLNPGKYFKTPDVAAVSGITAKGQPGPSSTISISP